MSIVVAPPAPIEVGVTPGAIAVDVIPLAPIEVDVVGGATVEVDVLAGPDVRVEVAGPNVDIDVTAGSVINVEVAAMGVPGPRGAPGSGGGSAADESIAALMDDHDSLTHGATVEIVHDETEPAVDLVVLIENALA